MEIISKYLGSGELLLCRSCDTKIIIPEKTQETKEPHKSESNVSKDSGEESNFKYIGSGEIFHSRPKESYNSELDTPKISKRESNIKFFMSPAGACLAFICFFLPWIKFSCSHNSYKYLSGADLGGIFWLVFIGAIVIIGTFFIFRSQKQVVKSKPYIIVSSLVALAIMLFKYIEFISGGVKGIKPSDIGLTIQLGAIITIIGFIAALIGSSFLNLEKETTSIRSCEDCGAKLQHDENFCSSCGLKITSIHPE